MSYVLVSCYASGIEKQVYISLVITLPTVVSHTKSQVYVGLITHRETSLYKLGYNTTYNHQA